MTPINGLYFSHHFTQVKNYNFSLLDLGGQLLCIASTPVFDLWVLLMFVLLLECVVSMLDIREPRSDKNRFHYLCL